VGGMRQVSAEDDLDISSLFSVTPPRRAERPTEAPPLTPQVVRPPMTNAYASESDVGSYRESASLTTGKEMPQNVFKPGTDPLIVETLNLLETVMCGGVIVEWATRAYDDMSRLATKLREKHCVRKAPVVAKPPVAVTKPRVVPPKAVVKVAAKPVAKKVLIASKPVVSSKR